MILHPHKFDSKYFGDKVKRFRLDLGLTLRQAAADTHISASTISRIERGESPDLVSFGQLCAWMREDPARFFVVDPERF